MAATSKPEMAEHVERRVLAESKTERPAMTSTQSEGETGSGLFRLRTAAKRDRRFQFNNLLHHVSEARLAEACRALNRKAALGVDGVSWEA